MDVRTGGGHLRPTLLGLLGVDLKCNYMAVLC